MAELTPALVATFPRPGAAIPGRISYAPDGRSITFLFSERADLVRDLWRLDLKTGRRWRWLSPPGEGTTDLNVSREEALRRERQRRREGGVTDYAWAERAMVAIVPIRGELYRWNAEALTRVTAGTVDPQVTRDGRRIFFVREGEVWCVDEAGERQLTTGASDGLTNGLAEFVAQEELDRLSGFWPSPDGELVAFEHADERHIPIYPIVHQGQDTVEVENHRYPFAGAANARVSLGVVSALVGDPTWLDLGADGDLYLARVNWHPDGRLFVQVLSRDQRRLELRAYDASNGRGRCLLVEEGDPWINLHTDLRFNEKTGEFVWASEQAGFTHLSLHDASGRLVRQLTEGDWPVDATLGLDQERRLLYFVAGRDTPVERHLYRVSLDAGEPTQLTAEPGMHGAVFSPDCSTYVHVFDSRSQPPSCLVRNADGTVLHTLHPAASVDLDLPPPSLHTFQTTDGATLHAAVYRPPTRGRAPVIVSVYGGPHAQMVTDSWDLTVDLRAQLLAARGFCVLKVDNRGSSRRGLRFEAAVAGNLGDLEVRDQVEGVRWLGSQGFADVGRVGIYGWSYGGYLSAMAMVKAPDVFKAAVAGAPVTSWDGYDTAYTERYLRTPRANPQGYADSSVLLHADRLRGKLLLVHGLLDENVHFRHTARLMDALIKAGKPYDVLLYPNERHMPRSESDRTAMETAILEYFEQNL